MFNHLKSYCLTLGIGLLTLTLTIGCSSTSSLHNELSGPISVPSYQIYYSKASAKTLSREQNLLTNLLLVLESDAKSPEDKAEVFYELATVYDELGLENLARFMLMNSIVNKPGFYKPYELLGIYFLKEGRVADACDAFDSAIFLGKDKTYAYPYLNRAFAMYYSKHYKLALEDMMYFYREDPADTYRLINLYFIELKTLDKQTAFDNLNRRFEELQAKSKKKIWGEILVKLCLNQISEKELFEDIVSYQNDDDLFQEHLCEAYFYIGKLKLEQGLDKLAFDYFSLCRQTRKYGFLEYRNAYLEQHELEKKYSPLVLYDEIDDD